MRFEAAVSRLCGNPPRGWAVPFLACGLPRVKRAADGRAPPSARDPYPRKQRLGRKPWLRAGAPFPRSKLQAWKHTADAAPPPCAGAPYPQNQNLDRKPWRCRNAGAWKPRGPAVNNGRCPQGVEFRGLRWLNPKRPDFGWQHRLGRRGVGRKSAAAGKKPTAFLRRQPLCEMPPPPSILMGRRRHLSIRITSAAWRPSPKP